MPAFDKLPNKRDVYPKKKNLKCHSCLVKSYVLTYPTKKNPVFPLLSQHISNSQEIMSLLMSLLIRKKKYWGKGLTKFSYGTSSHSLKIFCVRCLTCKGILLLFPSIYFIMLACLVSSHCTLLISMPYLEDAARNMRASGKIKFQSQDTNKYFFY